MTTLFVRHDVEHYATWRAGYDAFASLREESGIFPCGALGCR